ncbi:MAG TPA: SIMPL domain-containing protein [Candidatus Limnocylindrales bacterium]|nr:SIMPL domain-containing protein [Candidatus Limnocylindrales bacterium]
MTPTTVTLTMPLPDARVRWLAGGLAVGLLAAAFVGSGGGPRSVFAADPATPAEHTLTVTGTGRVVVTPDVADLRLGVVVTRPTVKAARSVAADQMTKVIAALKKLGIADKDIQTTGLSLQPNYDYSNSGGPARLTGYTLSNGVATTVRNLDRIGDAIDASIAAGATTLDGVAFRVDDPARAQDQARADAMKQARAKADTLASGAGVSIRGVASIAESAGPTPYPVYFGSVRGGVAADKATPVEVGSNDVTVNVSVSYLIG